MRQGGGSGRCEISDAVKRWYREFREAEKIRPHVEAALAASDASLRKAFGMFHTSACRPSRLASLGSVSWVPAW
ncbi:hypothetical protein FHU13_005619 [Methylobacterium sp. R2-1]|nr:hypothetical protein [Methylobacterium sp. R2-1]